MLIFIKMAFAPEATSMDVGPRLGLAQLVFHIFRICTLYMHSIVYRHAFQIPQIVHKITICHRLQIAQFWMLESCMFYGMSAQENKLLDYFSSRDEAL